ncbi:DarT ssDNA thymidine ADP-ribosyltransferase family protein [Lewinella sp. 4G2]|uniref:DarT ssDNA thymidine ADP-ribosyltransferase family protein n=1 Tax=Lewinella sp. 4G2 TaxID=1803372 RepID=UPI0007B4EE9E|nr:DarT ssDNA thymidine ADP-ribosyltransferase family protein [Lewinella sp. 4G2]OAV44068.1 hypothetical protein A3850_005955 [Lewinella sp. 4G2]
MSSQLIQFSHSWPVVVTDYIGDIRKVFEVTDLDSVICRIINETVNKEIEFDDLGLVLGFGMKTLTKFDEHIKFYKDPAEINILNKILAKCTEFNLIERVLGTSTIRITDWGIHALAQREKFEFWKCTLSSFKHASFELGEATGHFPYFDLGLEIGVRQDEKYKEPYALSAYESSLTQASKYALLNSKQRGAYIIDEVPDSNFQAKRVVYIPMEVCLYEDQTTLGFSYGGKNLKEISQSIGLESNSELRSYLQRKGLYTYLLTQDKLLSSSDMAPYVADDFFNPVFIVNSGKIDWYSEGIFNFFVAGTFADHTVWVAISEVCPVQLLVQNAPLLHGNVFWPTLTQRGESKDILSNVFLNWDLDLVLEKLSEIDLLDFLDQRLLAVPKVSSEDKNDDYMSLFPDHFWETVTEQLSDENLEKYLFQYPLSFVWITTNKETLCKRVLLEDVKWKNDVFSRQWNWVHISSSYDTGYLAKHFKRFGPYLDARRLFLQITKDEESLTRFLKSRQTSLIKEKLAAISFKLSYFHQVVLNDSTLALLEENELLGWGSNGVDGVEIHPDLVWTGTIIENYGHHIQSENACELISCRLSSIQVAIDNPDLAWDWVGIIAHYDQEEVTERWSIIQQHVGSENLATAYVTLSEKLTLVGAVDFCDRVPNADKHIVWHAICSRSTGDQIEAAYVLISEKRSSILTDEIIRLCTRKVSLNYIVEHQDLCWDWASVTRDKIPSEEIGRYFEVLAPYLDLEFIVKNIYNREQLNDLDFLRNLAEFIEERGGQTKNILWKFITEQTDPETLWSYIDKTYQSSVFHWDWTVISGSPDFLRGHIDDLRNGRSRFFIDNSSLIDWSVLVENKYFKGFLKKDKHFDNLTDWSNRVYTILNPIVNYIDWTLLSANLDITRYTPIVRAYQKHWNWDVFSEYSNIITKREGRNVVLDLERVNRFKRFLNFHVISSRSGIRISQELVFEYGHENLNWELLSANWSFNFSWGLFFEGGEPENNPIRDKYGQLIMDKGWDFKAISRRKDARITPDLIQKLIDKGWDWEYFSSQNFITKDFVLETLGKDWNWVLVSENKSVLFEKELIRTLIKKDVDGSINWYVTSSSEHFMISMQILSLFPEKILQTLNWSALSKSEHLDTTQLENGLLSRFSEYWDWKILVEYDNIDLSIEVLSNYNRLIPSDTISEFTRPEVLSSIVLDSIKENIDWDIICRRSDLESLMSDLEFISRNKRYLNWGIISRQIHVAFTKELLKTYYDLWDWSALKKNPRIVENDELLSYVTNCIETDSRLHFLDRIDQQDSNWSGYIYHFTNLPNAIKVLNSSSILSRDNALARLDNFDDAAGLVVGRRNVAHAYARFYFRPQTPTQFYNEELGQDQSSIYERTYGSALRLGLPKCPVPIFFRFRLQKVLFDSSIEYKVSNGNMQTNWAKPLNLEKAVRAFNFDEVYSVFPDFRKFGSFGGFDRIGFRRAMKSYIDKSQQEFLVKDKFEFSGYHDFDIIVKDEHVRSHLVDLLEDERLKKKVIVDDRESNVFHSENRTIRVDKDGDTVKVKTDYENDHKIKLVFGEPFNTVSVDGHNVSIAGKSIEFESHLILKLQKELDFKVEFKDCLLERSWEVFPFKETA